MTTARRIRRAARLAIYAALLAPALALVAFGPRSSRVAPPDRTVVTYWEKWTDFEGEAMRRLVDVFNATAGAEQNIHVEYVVTTQIDLKTLVATAGGDPPDLAGLWPHNISSFAAKGALQPLTARAAAAGIDADRILPVYYRQCVYHDELFGVPLTPWSIALYYNRQILHAKRDALAAAGLDADRPPRTLDELLAYCRVLCVRDARGEIERMGFLPGTPETVGWYWHVWGLWHGGTLATDAAGRFRVDTEPFFRGYEWIESYLREFGQRDVVRFESSLANFNSPDNPFMTGKLVMMQQGPWFANMIRQYAPEIDYGAAPFPTADGRAVGYCGQDVLVIPTGARHPEQAWAFIAWLYTAPPVVVPSGQAEPQPGYEYYVARTADGPVRRPMPPLRPIEWLCRAHYKNSPLRDTSPEFVQSHPNPVVDVHDRLARSPGARTEPPLPNWNELLAEFMAAYRDIWAGRGAARPRLRECQARIDALLDLARRRQARYGEAYP